MREIMRTYKIILVVLLAFVTLSCSEDLLNEKPLDFLSPENSYTTPEGIEAALNANYSRLNGIFNGHETSGAYHHVGTDLCAAARNSFIDHFGDYRQLTENNSIPANLWNNLYKMIFEANVIIGRIKAVNYPNESIKNIHIAEAMFFRGWAYKTLANLYAGVPIVLEEITSPKTDFVRETREATYNQAISDMEFAAQNLPDVNKVSAQGRVNSAAANHFLSELYISTERWDDAIAAANKVINNPEIQLMTTRFGRKAGQEGDPFWDLFQRGNQNRGNGNKEGILVLQEAFNIPGGSDPLWYGGGGFFYERMYGPLFWLLKDEDGVSVFNGKPYSDNGGRPVGNVRPTNYFSYTIWDKQNWDVDLRNNSRNIIRDWKVLNPASKYYGGWASAAKQAFIAQDTLMSWYPLVTKITTPNDHPDEVIANSTTGELIGTSGKTFKDWYLVRVAETYLLRAEAKLGKGDKEGAAGDVNVIRNRVNAIPIIAADVDIDYILDERMRELSYEEARRMTLCRLGKLYERTVLGNEFAGKTIQPHQNLYPIPFSEIERNTGAVLEQNAGY